MFMVCATGIAIYCTQVERVAGKEDLLGVDDTNRSKDILSVNLKKLTQVYSKKGFFKAR